jgi:hypothetical protein
MTRDDAKRTEALRGRLFALALAHNKAVLVAVLLSVLFALGFGAAAFATAVHGHLSLALPSLALGAFVLSRGLRLHRRVIRDLGPGRRAAAALALALEAQGNRSRLEDLEARFAREDLLRALDFLSRLGLAWAEPRSDGAVIVLSVKGGLFP